MKTIIITGPSGSGKSYLSKKISKLFNNTIVIKTDSYYKDNIFIRFLSIFQHDIYDRPLSFKKNEPDFPAQNFVEDIGKANPFFLNRNSMNPHQCFSGKTNPLLQNF